MPEPTTTQSNIEKILQLEEEGESGRTAADRLSEAIGRFVGTLSFVVVEVVAIAIWIALNLGKGAFDPYPFPLLAVALGFEAVVLTAFVLIRQNRTSQRADRRNHLDLQINLLAEQEATKTIQMLERMSRRLGIEREVTDAETHALASDTSIEDVAKELKEQSERGG